MTKDDQMDVEPAIPAETPEQPPDITQEDDEEDLSDLVETVDDASSKPAIGRIPLLLEVLKEERYGPKATLLKERVVYDVTRAYCELHDYTQVVPLLQTSPFFDHVSKAKCAKVVRAVLDLVCQLAPDQLEMQADICRSIVDWCTKEKRSFLRQRVQAKLAAVLLEQSHYGAALNIIDKLLVELKKLDDKQLLVETHLLESKVHFALRNVPKSKAALTASRTAANSIYVAPSLQATIDNMSGVLHCQEGDYDTAHSYFLESFEQLDTLNDRARALPNLKYMMLCRILDSLHKALALSAKGGIGAKSTKSDVDISGMLTGRQGVKYAGRDIEAMSAIAAAASKRSLKEFEQVTTQYPQELQDDLLIRHHLHVLYEQLLESNLIRLIEPYSCVEMAHIAELMEMPLHAVEKKLSQMILDGKFHGILDQGKGQLIVYEEPARDEALEKGLQVIGNMDHIVTSLFERSRALRTMML